MKKLLLLLVFAGFCLTLNAQVRYLGEIETGYGIGVGSSVKVGKVTANVGAKYDRVPLHLINGIKVGDFFSVGVGIGVDYYNASNFKSDLPELMMPVFLDVKGYLPISARNTVSLYGQVDVGYSFGVTAGVTDWKGLYLTPAVGVRFALPNSRYGVLLGVGYNLQRVSENKVGLNMSAVQIKAGFQF